MRDGSSSSSSSSGSSSSSRHEQATGSDLLSLAIVIPALNEEAHIQHTLQSIRGGGDSVTEVIVVDGGSTDRTVSIAHANGARVVRSERGRGPQQNAGWRASRADWCLFLHADTQLPCDYHRLITAATQRQPRSCWGCFRTIHLTQVPRWQSALVRCAVALRTWLLRLPYGDQALFVRRRALEELEGFACLEVMEDVELVSRLGARCRPALVPAAASTSGRRYTAVGFWANVAANNLIMLGWALGVEPRLLGRAYQALGQRGAQQLQRPA